MPARQPTPGPSTLGVQADTLQLHNTKKRAVSENALDDEQRQSKKHRKDVESENKPVATPISSKDSKKKRRKKKRKSPLTIPDTNPESASTRSKSKEPIPPSLASSITLSEASISSPATAVELLTHATSTVLAKSLICKTEEDEKLALSFIDKGKAKAPSEYPDILISQSNESTVAPPMTDSMKDAQAKIAELTAQLEAQKTLLSRHEDNLSHLQQSLTCQICLDLLYKPYALSPCGHIACYLCLVRWFTSIQNDNPNANAGNTNPVTEPDDVTRLLNSQPALRGVFLRNHKSCPLCRAAILERPAEIWSIKSMVAHLIKSKLVEPPSAPPPSATETPNANERLDHYNDPWRNIFGKPGLRELHRHRHQPQFFPPPPANHEDPGGGWDLADMGMYDAEDGGIYRCLDCMHEIWGGVCTNCHREYAGHARFDDDDDEDDFSDGSVGPGFLGRRLREIWDGYARDNPGMGWPGDSEDDEGVDVDDDDDDDADDDIDVDMLYGQPFNGIDLTDDGSMSGEGSVLGDTEAARFTSSSSEDGEDSEHSWSSDGEEDEHDALPGHQIDVIDMIHDVPHWPFGQRLPLREPGGVAHIEEVDDAEEEEDAEAEAFHSGSDSHSHSHPNSEEEDEEGYEDSFIDDDEEDDVNVHDTHKRNRRQGQDIDLIDSEDDDDGNNHRTIALARRLGGGIRFGVPRDPGDDSEDDGHNAGRRRHQGAVRTAHHGVVHGEPSDDDQEEEEAIRPAGRRWRNLRRNGAAAFHRALFEDEEDE